MRFAATLAVSLVTTSLGAQIPSFPSESELAGKTSGTLVTNLGQYDGFVADWGYLLVPENRTASSSRLMRLAVVRQRAGKQATGAPVFNLVGGPGQSNIWGSGGIPAPILAEHDVVRVGYRGIDGDVELVCREYCRALQTESPLAPESLLAMRAALRQCNRRLREEGVDLDGYNLVEVVKDIEATRIALGYERISFLAVSWGTQIAYSYAIAYADRVERMLLIGAGGRARGFDLWDPEIVDRKIRQLGGQWQRDPVAVRRSRDIVATIRRVLASLPASWQGHRIDPDRVRLGTYYMLDSGVSGAARVLDAFASAERGDFAGLALLSLGYDDEVGRRLRQEHGPYDGEFFSKVMSSGLDPNRDFVSEMERPGSIIGSPVGKLLFGAATREGWPIAGIPEEFCRDKDIETSTLVLMGQLDFSSPHEYVENELMPHLKNGHLIVIPNMGHTDVVGLQPEAFAHLAVRFLCDGVVDASKYEHHAISFTPTDSLGAEARRVFGEKN